MDLEKKIMEFTRRGDQEKVRWLKNLDKAFLPSVVERIQQNDKSVLKETVVPKWVTWDFLYEWAMSKKVSRGTRCILCNELSESGINFKEKFICEGCFLKLKNLNQ